MTRVTGITETPRMTGMTITRITRTRMPGMTRLQGGGGGVHLFLNKKFKDIFSRIPIRDLSL